MAESITIAALEDCQSLAELDARCNASPWKSSHFQAALQNSEIRLIKRNQQIIAFIVWQRVLDEIELHLIATTPEYRRQGLAQLLITAMLEEAQMHSTNRIFLEVRQSNENAQKLYQKNGFIECGVRHHYYRDGENALLMEKSC